MKKATLKALLGSIRKWEDIAAGTGEDLGMVNCDLCQRFCIGADPCIRDDGEKCPVHEKTGATNCKRTPYIHWLRLHDYRSGELRSGLVVNTKPQKAAARAELEFLKSLLP